MTKVWLKSCGAVLFGFLILLGGLEPVNLLATDEPVHEVLVNIDETIGSLSGLFDDISRFNRFGLAVISKNVDPSQTIAQTTKKYGIINLQGEVVLDTIYDDLIDLNENYWIVGNWVKDERGAFYVLWGLVSKQTGAMVMPAVYAEIPDFSTMKYSLLVRPTLKIVEGLNIYVEKKELKTFEVGSIRDAVLPTGINLFDYDSVYETVIGGFHFVNAHWEKTVSGNTTWKSDTWLIDEKGDAVLDFTFEQILETFTREDGAVYINYVNRSHNIAGTPLKAGVLKVSNVNGKITTERFLTDVKKYYDLRINTVEKRIYYTDSSGIFWYFDLLTDTSHKVPSQPQNINLTITCGWIYPASDPANQVYKCGLKKSDGTMLLEMIYDSIEYVTEGYYAVGMRNSDTILYQLMKDNGEFILTRKYTYITYYEPLNWLVMYSYASINDRENPGKTFKVYSSTYYNLVSGKIVVENVYVDLNMLATHGYAIATAFTGEGIQRIEKEVDSNGNVINTTLTSLPDEIFGVLGIDGYYLLEPEYTFITPLFDNYEVSMKFAGYYEIEHVESTHICGSRWYDSAAKKMVEETHSCQIIRRGIFSAKDGMVLAPKYTNIFYSGNDIIQARYTDFVRNEKTEYVEDLGRDELFYYAGPSPLPKWGLVSISRGELVPPLYEGFSSTTDNAPQQGSNIAFNQYGYMKVYKSNWDGVNDNTYYNLIGLVSRNGVVIEPIYKTLYFKNGYLYMQDIEGTWTVKNALDFSQTITIDKSFAEDVEYDSVQIVGDYLVIESKVVSDLESYSVYGIYNKDLTEFLPMEFTSVSFDGTYWYLEKYDKMTGSYPRAIMDTDKHYIVEFSSKYDYLSEFVGGYAVGQSGIKTTTVSTRLGVKKYAGQKAFVLNIINQDGIVVSDLSNQYESVTLLGQIDGVTRALVKKDGIFYFANLVEGPGIIKIKPKFNPIGWILGGLGLTGMGILAVFMLKKRNQSLPQPTL